MKRFVMQLLRLGMTIAIMLTMAAMIFSLRDQVAMWKARARENRGTLETIRTRTSIRAFDPARSPTEAQVDELLRAAMSAPTAVNTQPWHFVVVRDAATLKALDAGLPYARLRNGATMAVVICGMLDNGLKDFGREFWIQDCSAASENLLLAAHALGLGAVWTAVYPDPKRIEHVRRILGIPDGFMPLNVIPVGFPAEHPQPKDKWKPERIHSNRW